MARYFTFPFLSCARPCLPTLRASAPPSFLSRLCLLLGLALPRMLLVVLGMGCDVGTLNKISS